MTFRTVARATFDEFVNTVYHVRLLRDALQRATFLLRSSARSVRICVVFGDVPTHRWTLRVSIFLADDFTNSLPVRGGGATGGRRVCVFDTRDRYFSRPPRDTWTHALPRPVIKFPRYSVSSDTAATVAQRSDTTCAYDAPDSISAVRPHRPRAAICHIQL